jgi:hypothetical protein
MRKTLLTLLLLTTLITPNHVAFSKEALNFGFTNRFDGSINNSINYASNQGIMDYNRQKAVSPNTLSYVENTYEEYDSKPKYPVYMGNPVVGASAYLLGSTLGTLPDILLIIILIEIISYLLSKVKIVVRSWTKIIFNLIAYPILYTALVQSTIWPEDLAFKTLLTTGVITVFYWIKSTIKNTQHEKHK